MKYCFYILTFAAMVTPYTSFGMDQFLKFIDLRQKTQQERIEAIALDPRNQEINHKFDTIERLEKEVEENFKKMVLLKEENKCLQQECNDLEEKIKQEKYKEMQQEFIKRTLNNTLIKKTF